MSDETNVISFPKPKREVLADKPVYDINTVVVDNSLEMMHTVIMKNLVLLGYDGVIEDEFTEKTRKDQTLLFEAIKSLLLKYHDQQHPFQSLAEHIFIVDESGEMTIRTIDYEENASSERSGGLPEGATLQGSPTGTEGQ